MNNEKKYVVKRDANNLTFFEHAQELRVRIFFSVILIFILFIGYFVFAKHILVLLTAPLHELGYKLHYYKVHETFFSTIKISFFAALISSIPVLLWSIIGFILPALEKKDRLILVIATFFSVLFLFSGFIFSYKVLIPLSLNYLLSFSQDEVESVISIGFFIDFFLTLFFATGVGFQLPLIMLLLNRFNLVTYKTLAKGRKFAVIIILIASAIITPPDVISQVVLGVPLYFLFEIGLILILFTNRKKS